ncbi:MAG TPA: hypothetical protein VGF99_15330 [Myxococcota bacterium]
MPNSTSPNASRPLTAPASIPAPLTRPATRPPAPTPAAMSAVTFPASSSTIAANGGRVATGGMMPTATGTMPIFADATHLRGHVVFHRDGIKVSRLIMPAGTELPAHTLNDDLVIVVLRGKGIVYAQQEPRHVEAGSVVDLVPGEEHSIDCFEELELVITQASLASRQQQVYVPPAG